MLCFFPIAAFKELGEGGLQALGILEAMNGEWEMADLELASLKICLFYVVKAPRPGISKILGILHYFLNLKRAET